MSASLNFEVPYRAEAFGPEIADTGVLTFSAGELAHALFATGRTPGDQAKHGYASVWEWLHRISVIPAYIRRTPDSRLVRSRLAQSMDRSEKVSLSYALGQALTGVFSKKILSVPYLMHVDRYARRYGVRFTATRQRADLFGRSSTGWVVAEAKGRSQAMSADLPAKMIAQKRSIKAIDGEAPEVAFGCVSSFPRGLAGRESSLRLDAFDPVEDEITAITLGVNLDRFLLAYYEPFLAAVDMGDAHRNDGPFLVAQFEQLGVRVGLLRPIADFVRQAQDRQAAGLYAAVKEVLQGAEEQGLAQLGHGLAGDGTLVEAKWEPSLTLADY
ncbi:hypothetical protein ACKI1J_40520 [Streptomyces scabiei]|uniref:hypothetical protein n=1 Tax=Streptomyces scabiei TaxID=1930 RepID=UPI0038F75704